MPQKFTDDEVNTALNKLNKNLSESEHWSIKDAKLHKVFKFADFVQAFGWMTQIAICAERANHHPEWFNVYNKVIADLTTHDAGGISQLDFELAKKMDESA